MEFKEGKLSYPIGEIIPGPFGEIEGKKPQQQPIKKETKEEKKPTVKIKKQKI